MCTRYLNLDRQQLEEALRLLFAEPMSVAWAEGDESAGDATDELAILDEVFPAKLGYMLRIEREPRLRKVGKRFALVAGQFGLIAHWVRPEGMKKMTRACYNARTETVHEKPSFSTAWKQMNWCVIPAKAIFEPCYESGKAVPWRISRADGKPLWIAGIRWAYKLLDGKTLETYSMLTINADDHALFRRMHEPNEEKRMVVMLKDEDVEAWLDASTHDEARSFFTQYPAEELVAEAAPDAPRARKVTAKAPSPQSASPPEGPRQLLLGED